MGPGPDRRAGVPGKVCRGLPGSSARQGPILGKEGGGKGEGMRLGGIKYGPYFKNIDVDPVSGCFMLWPGLC